MDGTIWDAPIDWLTVRHEIGVPANGLSIYEQLMDMPSRERAQGIRILEHHEALGAENGTLIPGTIDLLQYLKEADIKCALITNNSRRSVERVLERNPLSFDAVLSRDDGALKPDPQAFLSALEQLHVSPQETIAIGDAHFDLIASDRAGIAQFILVGNRPWTSELIPAGVPHHKVADLVEAREIIARLLHQSR
ncbi:HAD-IA family hydrolase [Candidatus Bipolaricaulota bacterium]|nr:HAD-IA family hydrolase [Candidatus Bipolaricaulota bacterium]